MLTYLLTKEDLTPEEVNGHAIDVVANGVDTVSVEKKWIIIIYYLMNVVVNQCYYVIIIIAWYATYQTIVIAVIIIVISFTVCEHYHYHRQ